MKKLLYAVTAKMIAEMCYLFIQWRFIIV